MKTTMGRREYRRMASCILDAVLDHIMFITDLNDDDFRKELGVENLKKVESIRFIVNSETVNSKETIIDVDIPMGEVRPIPSRSGNDNSMELS